MAKRNSGNQDYTNNNDGWDLTGGVTRRKLSVSGGDITMTGGGAATINFPTTNDTLVGRVTTDTLTNKNIIKRFLAVTQSATPAINTDNADIFSITALAQAITSMTSGLTGTPNAGDMRMIQITDNGTARAITWGTSFASTTIALPTTTVISTLLRVLVEWDTVASKWQCIGVA